MRLLHSPIAILLCLLSVAVATAQDRAAPAPSAANTSQAQAAIDRAVAAKKYVFLFFWKDKTSQTDKAWNVLQPAMAKMVDLATVVSIQTTDPAEKKLVDKYGVSRAPLPLVLAVAPCGAITKAFMKTFDEKQLRAAFVSPGTQRCLKALQSRKLVFVCVVDQANPRDQVAIPKGVENFKADKKYGAATEVVLVNVRDAAEATFLKELDVGKASAPLTIFLAPPGSLIGRFGSGASKEVLMDKLAAAQSNPCGPGGCGPGGCGPKK